MTKSRARARADFENCASFGRLQPGEKSTREGKTNTVLLVVSRNLHWSYAFSYTIAAGFTHDILRYISANVRRYPNAGIAIVPKVLFIAPSVACTSLKKFRVIRHVFKVAFRLRAMSSLRADISKITADILPPSSRKLRCTRSIVTLLISENLPRDAADYCASLNFRVSTWGKRQ